VQAGFTDHTCSPAACTCGEVGAPLREGSPAPERNGARRRRPPRDFWLELYRANGSGRSYARREPGDERY